MPEPTSSPASADGSTQSGSDITQAHATFRDQLKSAGVISSAGSPGLYDRHAAFTTVFDGVGNLISRTRDNALHLASDGVYGIHRFSPIFPAEVYEKTDYIESFPHLTGSLNVFTGDNKQHRELVRARVKNQPWNDFLHPSDSMMVSAACHPLYAQLPSDLPENGITADVEGWCFRHEPSLDPMRQQSFRMRELVHAGTPDEAANFRQAWIPLVFDMLSSLELPVDMVAANDPFFGRAGKMLADGQLENELKTEFVVPIYGPNFDSTAIASCNYAEDHFGTRFELNTGSGEPAHTACTAFGLERITLALFAIHGVDMVQWPEGVRSILGFSH